MDHVHAGGFAPLFAMWAAMMVGMMIPPEVPLLVRLARGPGAPAALRGTAAFLDAAIVKRQASSDDT